MGVYRKRWTPNASQKAEYREKMLAIEAAKEIPTLRGYDYGCTGDCVTGDEIAFFNAGKSAERLYGRIVNDNYGRDKQQHTFTIELLDGSKMLIKGRNLYKNGVLRRKWENEENRKIALDEKHDRGAKARVDRNKRKSEYEY